MRVNGLGPLQGLQIVPICTQMYRLTDAQQPVCTASTRGNVVRHGGRLNLVGFCVPQWHVYVEDAGLVGECSS